MKTSEILDITIITFNRAEYLQKTLNAVLAEDSPVRNCQITILDNKSTDSTSDVISRFAKKHVNITHITNNFNVGGKPWSMCP
jgi:glycosyltransferase involved in cell wall biosynthesis